MNHSPQQTPHSGYHGQGRKPPFFEGWYYRLTLPAEGETIAFMYSIQDASTTAQQPTRARGGAVQILGPGEQYFCRALPDVSRFWARRDRLGHGQTRRSHAPVPEGYRVTATQHEGCLWDVRSQQLIRWHYTIEPVYGWGPSGSAQQATAGWLSHLQIFEPGWQVLMAHGWATGWLEWGDRRYQFERVPAYAEKNWGGAFPKQWFWLQCNAFDGESDLSVTSAGGLRQVLGREESVGMVGVHWQGRFYEFASTFASTTGPLNWQVSPWGHWHIWAERGPYRIELVGQTAEAGVWVRVPMAHGMELCCRDTTRGELVVKLWEIRGRSRQLILKAGSQQAGLEIGGGPWIQDYVCS